MTLLEYLILAVIVVLLGLFGYFSYAEVKAEKIEIIKKDWECSKYDKKTMLQPMIIGKSTIMTPITDTVCVQYTHK